jgi:glycosyltransferase involved in cell wall biosynthesis
VSDHRVLHFLWSGELGGAERAVYQMVREEQRRGEWGVGVAFGQARGPWADALKALGCEVIDLRMRNTADLPRALRSTARLKDFDIHHFHVLELGQLAASARCADATRVFTQRHGRHEIAEPVRKRIRRSLGGVLLRRYIHAVSGNTRHATSYAIERYRLSDISSQVTYNGIDFALLAPSRDRLGARGEFGAGPDTTVVGSSGGFYPCKRFDRLVGLLEVLPTVQVILVGDGSLRGSLETQANASGTRDRLHITGLMSNIADCLQAMDIFVLPSSADESFGNSVVEAMAMGIPSIVFSDSPGLCEHIDDGVTGFIVGNQHELASIVEHLVADPSLRSRIGQAGARHVRSKYTLENMHESYRGLYEAALAGFAAGRK